MHDLMTLAIRDRAIPLWRLRQRDFGYMGWANRGNLGDEAMFDAFSAALGRRPPLLPLHRPGRAFLRVDSARKIVLGGGTLIFRDEWAARVQAVRAAMPDAALVVAGTACEDPDYALSTGVGSAEGERAWLQILKGAERIGVRGPISKRILADRGVEAEVIGDPALALPVARRLGTNTDVLLNFAAVADGYTDRHYGTLRQAVRRWQQEGLHVAVFGTERADLQRAQEVLGVNHGCEFYPFAGSVPELCDQIANARVVVSERLHGAILACTLGVPFVSLAYKPKIFDFLDSVDARAEALPTHSLDLDSLLDRVSNASSSGWLEKRVGLAERYRRFVLDGMSDS